ncbi:MAG TPA: hypothetical protein VF062_24870 [Candidatus Limnocylindrales bacterium]
MASRMLRPAGFVIAGLLMFMPFIAVSCDVPGGFGRAAPGGTTKYTGFDLTFGGEPTVEPADKIREGAPETLAPQPLAILLLLLLLAGIAVTIRVSHKLLRRATIALLSGVAAICLTVNQISVQTQLEERVPAKYVQNQPGFWLCLSTLLVVLFANAIGWLRTAAEQAHSQSK